MVRAWEHAPRHMRASSSARRRVSGLNLPQVAHKASRVPAVTLTVSSLPRFQAASPAPAVGLVHL
jgi:hypothetical protein